jgi:beta-galactosidase
MYYFGVAYYPEYWSEERWEEDAQLMAKADFNVVKLAGLPLTKIEPKPGALNVEWLDRVITLLASHGMKIVLEVPNATTSLWLRSLDGSLEQLDQVGNHRASVQHQKCCANHPGYQEQSRRIVELMADHYHGNPEVIGWQISNEFGGLCYCETCRRDFRVWLEERYGSIDKLNQGWGTKYLDYEYGDWSEILILNGESDPVNPGMTLDFARFTSDSIIRYQTTLIEVLRTKCPNQFTAHDITGISSLWVDYFSLVKESDQVSWNNYPRSHSNLHARLDPSRIALDLEVARCVKMMNFWVMAQQAGASGSELISISPKPGEPRLWAYQSIAHGAEGIVFAPWRSPRFGTKQYWHGVLDHPGRPGRRYEEIKGMGKELRKVGKFITGSVTKAAVALIFSFDSYMAFESQPNNWRFLYVDHFHDVYQAFYKNQVPVDIVSPEQDFSGYKLVIAPALHILPENLADRLKKFVETGGIVVATPRSGVKDEYNAVVDQALPGFLAEICGVEVVESLSLPIDEDSEIAFDVSELSSHSPLVVNTWCDVLKPHGAEVIARYSVDDFYIGNPAITLNRYGQGKAVYVGTFGDEVFYDLLTGWLLDLAEIEPTLIVPPGVEVAERWQGDKRRLFVLNHTSSEQILFLDGELADLLVGPEKIDGSISIPPLGVLLLGE